MSIAAVVLAGLAVVLLAPVSRTLSTAGWASREPRAALVLWQAVGLAAGLAAIGAVLAVATANVSSSPSTALIVIAERVVGGDPGAGLDVPHLLLFVAALLLLVRLLGVLVINMWRTWRGRRRHRAVLDLVSTPLVLPWAPHPPLRTGARVLDHPGVAAYCLPGSGSRVVLTSGALAVLDSEELDAVLAHERAHLTERHDLVLLPFAAFASALPFLPGPRLASGAVIALVEMLADDRACSGRERVVLAAALARFGLSGPPPNTNGCGALTFSDAAMLARIRRLLDPLPPAPRQRRAAYVGAAMLVLAPVLAIVLPGLL